MGIFHLEMQDMELTQTVSHGTAPRRWPAWYRPSWMAPDRFQWLAGPLSIAFLLLLWAVLAQRYPAWILPGPTVVLRRFVQVAGDGTLLRHTQATLVEALLGFALGFGVASCLGYVLAKFPLLEKFMAPLIVISQSTPVVAIAPLLLLWFGAGLLSKVLVCAVIVFFPMLVNTIVGLRSIDPEYRLLFKSYDASAWQTFIKLELPAALPVLFGGIRVGVTLSIVGAVVSEFLGSDRGLGALINIARGLFDTPLMFVALMMLTMVALVLYLSVVMLERVLTHGRRTSIV